MGKPADYNEAENPANASLMTSSDFWPTINLAEIRVQAGIDGSVTDSRLEAAVCNAMLHTNSQLADWANRHRQAGIAHLSEVAPDTVINKVPALILLYNAAVRNHAAATIYASLRDYGETAESSKKTASHTTKADEFRAAGRSDINMIMGLGRAEAYLI